MVCGFMKGNSKESNCNAPLLIMLWCFGISKPLCMLEAVAHPPSLRAPNPLYPLAPPPPFCPSPGVGGDRHFQNFVLAHCFLSRARVLRGTATCIPCTPPPRLYKLRPCPSYSRRRDRINLGLWRSLYKGGYFNSALWWPCSGVQAEMEQGQEVLHRATQGVSFMTLAAH